MYPHLPRSPDYRIQVGNQTKKQISLLSRLYIRYLNSFGKEIYKPIQISIHQANTLGDSEVLILLVPSHPKQRNKNIPIHSN